MATRLAIPKMPRIEPSQLVANASGAIHDLNAKRPATREAMLRFGWKAVFAPYWLWSDIPAPQPPQRDLPLPHGGLAGDHLAKALRAIALRAWLQRTLTILARAAWLGILVAVIWLAIEVGGGPEFDLGVLKWIAVAIFIPAIVLALLSKPSRHQVASMLDRSFHLQERIVTAIANIGRDVPLPGQRGEMPYLQVADAANAIAVVKSDSAFRVNPPVRELVLAITWALVFASLFFLRGGGGSIPDVESRNVPAFVPAAQQFVNTPEEVQPPQSVGQEVPTVAEIQELAERSNDAREDLLTLADALSDHAFTRSASSSLNQGSYAEAAQQLRDIAEQADQLALNERESLASDLESAASEMTQNGQPLAEASRSAAEGLREGGEPAAEGVEGLGDAVEQTANSIKPRESLDEAMRQAQEAEAAGDQSSSEQSQPGGQQSQSLFDNPMNQRDSDSSDGAGEQSSSEAAGEGANSESGVSEGAGEQPGEQQGSEPGSSGEGEPQTGSSAQAPSEDVTGGTSEGQYQEPEMDPNAQAADGQSEESAAGSGAGGDSSEISSGGDTGETQAGAEGEASEAEVTDAEGGEGSGDSETGEPRRAVTLARSPDGEPVQAPGSSGGSSLGPGAGVSVAGGEGSQGNVDIAGPDSNHVPGEYRSIVQSYFSNPDE